MNVDDWSSCKEDYMWNLSTCDCKCNKVRKINEYLVPRNLLCEKRLIGKVLLACEDEMVNTTEASLDNKRVTCEKIIVLDDFIGNYMLVSICYFN